MKDMGLPMSDSRTETPAQICTLTLMSQTDAFVGSIYPPPWGDPNVRTVAAKHLVHTSKVLRDVIGQGSV